MQGRVALGVALALFADLATAGTSENPCHYNFIKKKEECPLQHGERGAPRGVPSPNPHTGRHDKTPADAHAAGSKDHHGHHAEGPSMPTVAELMALIAQLEEQKSAAVAAEDYAAASQRKKDIDKASSDLELAAERMAEVDRKKTAAAERIVVLEQEKATAIAEENFALAMELKHELVTLEAIMSNSDPPGPAGSKAAQSFPKSGPHRPTREERLAATASLKRQIAAAVSKEDFPKAAKLKAEIAALEAKLNEPDGSPAGGVATDHSPPSVPKDEDPSSEARRPVVGGSSNQGHKHWSHGDRAAGNQLLLPAAQRAAQAPHAPPPPSQHSPLPPPAHPVVLSHDMAAAYGIKGGGWNLPPLDPPAAGCLSMVNCAGVNVKRAIKADLEPWALPLGAPLLESQPPSNVSGDLDSTPAGIRRADVDAAMSWGVLHDSHTKNIAQGWLRVTISEGKLYVLNLGSGFATRDAVFVLSLLELMQRPPAVPDVDFVVYTEDRARLAKHKYPKRMGPNRILPFALGFARSDKHWDVGVPDPSFFGWPELAVNPHWQLANAPVANIPWSDKANRVHWRGGLKRSGGLREAMINCAQRSKNQGWMDIGGHKSLGGKGNWEHPLAMGRFKLALFMQGEGYTSSKQRILASGSCPLFAELTEHDVYFGRFLKEGTHYQRVRVGNESMQCGGHACVTCMDLDRAVKWVETEDGLAKKCANEAKRFSDLFFSRRALLEYLRTLLVEVAAIQAPPKQNRRSAGSRGPYDYAAVVKEVHEPRGSGLSLTPANAVRVMQLSCGDSSRSEDKRDCPGAVALVKWWLELPLAEYTPKGAKAPSSSGALTPPADGADGEQPVAPVLTPPLPCRSDLCKRCCEIYKSSKKDPK